MRIGKGESNASGAKESALNAWHAILLWPLSSGPNGAVPLDPLIVFLLLVLSCSGFARFLPAYCLFLYCLLGKCCLSSFLLCFVFTYALSSSDLVFLVFYSPSYLLFLCFAPCLSQYATWKHAENCDKLPFSVSKRETDISASA